MKEKRESKEPVVKTKIDLKSHSIEPSTIPIKIKRRNAIKPNSEEAHIIREIGIIHQLSSIQIESTQTEELKSEENLPLPFITCEPIHEISKQPTEPKDDDIDKADLNPTKDSMESYP